jgi:myo-inositol-1-phosphate synthase
MSDRRVGIWLVGAKGGVASTAILGLSALKRGLIASDGLVSCLPPFQRLPLADWSNIVVGGHEIRKVSLVETVLRLTAKDRIAPVALVEQCREELEQIDRRIRPGTIQNVGPTIAALADDSVPRDETPRQAIDRLRGDMAAFVQSERLAHLVVVNVASTEPPVDAAGWPASWAELGQMLDNPRTPHTPCAVDGTRSVPTTIQPTTIQPTTIQLPASSLYAIAAFEAGCSFINFTPSLGPAPMAIDELARLRGVCYYGCDGKTGETLMKSVLAPMFAQRNLRVLSWVGHNIFGNMDADVLDDPTNKQAKVASKDHLIREILGYRPQTLVSIEKIADMGDWKSAWDHIHFSGFLGLPMTLQFTWQGCDSALAAPLVLDLVRFTELAHRRGQVGQMPFLANFFKSPYGTTEHRFDRQYRMLEDWAETMQKNEG